MCNQYPALYINLERATDRQQAFEAQAAFAACGMHRLEAVDGQSLTKATGAKLKRGQQGCVKSHLRAWEKARYSAATSPYTVVFEDDFQLGDYASRIPQVLDEAEHACNGQPADVKCMWWNRAAKGLGRSCLPRPASQCLDSSRACCGSQRCGEPPWCWWCRGPLAGPLHDVAGQ